VKYSVLCEVPNILPIELELDDTNSPKTVTAFLENLPMTLSMNLWGREIYTEESPISVALENGKSEVELFDVAFWPTGKAICLFFGPTPISKKNEIKPYSPVSVIGKIINSDKDVLSKLKDGMKISFKLKSS